MKLFALLFAFFYFASSLQAEDVYTLAQKAEQAEKEQNYEKARELYADALARSPEDAILNYNQGRIHYRLKQYEEAQKNFELALSTKDPKLEKQIRKNLGNTHVQKSKDNIGNPELAIEDLEKALSAFQEAEQVPLKESDPDLALNQELTKNLIKKIRELIPPQESQQSPEDQEDSDQQDKDDQQQDSTEKQSNQSEEKNSQQDSRESSQENAQDAQQQNAQRQNKSDQTESEEQKALPLTQKEVEELLKQARMNARERQKQLEQRKEAQRASSHVEKDW